MLRRGMEYGLLKTLPLSNFVNNPVKLSGGCSTRCLVSYYVCLVRYCSSRVSVVYLQVLCLEGTSASAARANHIRSRLVTFMTKLIGHASDGILNLQARLYHKIS